MFHPVVGVVFVLQVLFLSKLVSGKVQSTADRIEEDILNRKKLVENLKETLSSDINPCFNFYSYVCKKYTNTDSIDFKNMLVLDPYLKMGKDLSESEIKARDYMHSCEHKTDEDIGKFVKHFKFKKSMGGWPALDPNWNSKNLDLQAVIAEFASYYIWVPIHASFMGHYLYVRVQSREFYIFMDSQSQLQLNNTLKKIGVKDMDAVLSDAMQFEKEYRAARIYTNWYEPTVETNFINLKEEIPELDWDKYIKTTERRKLPDDYSVHMVNGDGLRKALQTISKMDPKVFANYFFCQFLLDFPYYAREMSKKDCWRKTHDVFQTVLSQAILNKFLNQEAKEKMLSLIRTYVDTLYKYLPPPEIATNRTKPKYPKQMLKDYFARLSDDSISKEFKDLSIDQNSYALNYYKISRYNSFRLFETFSEINWHWSSYMELKIAKDFPYQIYKINKKFWTSVYSHFAIHYFSVQLEIIERDYNFSTPLSDCFGGKVWDKDSVRKAITLQILTKVFSDWTAKNERIIQADNHLLEEYGLNVKKALFVGVMQLWCEESNSNEVNSRFAKFKEFGDTFNCPVGTPMNPAEKCDIDKFQILV